MSELFLERATRREDVLVRATWNRRVVPPEKLLWETVAAQAEAGRLELAVPRRGQQPARPAWLGVRPVQIPFRPPRWRAKEKLPNVKVYAVLAREESPAAGIPAFDGGC